MTSSCLVYSDSDVTVASTAALTAPQTEAVTTATGPINVAPLTKAVPVADPFANAGIKPPSLLTCNGPNVGEIDVKSNTTFPPLVPICGPVVVFPGVTLTLGTSKIFGGEHYLGYSLTLQPGAHLKGTDVVLFFGKNATLSFQPNATISLSGRQSGPYAGFVLVTDVTQTTPFILPSDPFQTVTGTIYSPTAPIVISGTTTAAQASDPTSTVAPEEYR